VKISSDREQCIASGTCVLMCPEVFAQDGDGLVVILDEAPPESLHRDVREAIDSCSAACIWDEEEA
jgi:ferredoxin